MPALGCDPAGLNLTARALLATRPVQLTRCHRSPKYASGVASLSASGKSLATVRLRFQGRQSSSSMSARAPTNADPDDMRALDEAASQSTNEARQTLPCRAHAPALPQCRQ